MEIRLHAVLGVWLVWQVQNLGIAGHGNKTISPDSLQGGLVARIESQDVSLETWQDPDDQSTLLSEHSFRFPLPPFQISSRLVNNIVKCRAMFELFEIILNANAIDAFVRASRQLASSDLDRILAVLKSSSASASPPRSTFPSPLPATFDTFELQAQLLFTGFHLVLEGESSLCYFDVDNIYGEGSSPQSWQFKVSDVSFSLAPKIQKTFTTDFDRRYRLAYMLFDFQTTSSIDSASGSHVIDVRIDKVHAVLQAAALGVLGDLVDSYQVGENFHCLYFD
jgi:hypothetical protein